MRQLTAFSPEWEVLELLIEAYFEDKDVDQDMIYDNVNDRYISADDAFNLVEQLKDLEEMCA